jgi:HTH-type transcriptional regulator, repressor for puuD
MISGCSNTEDMGRRLSSLRERRSLSMRKLANKSGTSASLISKIEAGRVSPTVASLQKIMEAMNTDLYELFLDQPGDDPSEQIVFSKSDMAVYADSEHVEHHAFHRHPNIKAELTFEEYQPNSEVVRDESHRGDICGFVIEGEQTIEIPGRTPLKAEAGDAFYIKGDQPHTLKNTGGGVLKMVCARAPYNGHPISIPPRHTVAHVNT